jgi:hypothetical protein
MAHTALDMEPSARAIDLLTGPAGGALRAALAPTERVTHAARGIGSTIALTTLRLLVIRDGAVFRPKTGVRSWALDDSLDVRPWRVRPGSGSLVIRTGRDVTSVFVPNEEWSVALELVGALRGRIRRGAEDRRTRGD